MSYFILAKDFLTDSQHMLSLEFCVFIDWRIGILIVLYCKSSRLSVLNELLKLISYHIFQAIFKRSDAAFHVSAL